MSVDGKDKIEIQDALDRVKIHLAEYENDTYDEEEAYNNIKDEVTR